MDRLQSMNLLLEVVKSGSLSAAGRALRQPLPTVSRKISELEAHLGAKIFARTNRQLQLTEAGQAYVQAVRRILDDLDAAESAMAGEYSNPKGELVITAPLVFGRLHVVPVVADFLKAHPQINIRLFLADRLVNLTDDHVDVAVRIGHLPDSSLKAVRLGTIHGIVCASPAYLKERPPIVSPDDLTHHDCINFAAINAPDRWTFRFGRIERPVAIRSRLAVNTAEAALDACASGLGLTRVLSYQAAAMIKSGAIVPVLQSYEPDAMPVHMLYAGQDTLPQKLRLFLDFASPRLKNALHS